MSYDLLDKVNSPADLRALDDSDMGHLADEMRRFLIESCEKKGGHLASNLGAVELTLAIHRVFDSPRDHIVFDVGHQAYVHKIITGRRKDFFSLREPGGLSGFTSMRESEHDAFGAGHSSTSVSAALGLAEADALAGNGAYTVCVIGDGAYTGGMVHEALNNCNGELPLIIILNENGMSISRNKGTFASYLSRVRVSGGYRRWKTGTKNFLVRLPLIGRPLHRFFSFAKKKIKRLIYRNNYFEELGLYYIGPLDGNDYTKVATALRGAKELGKTAVVHLKTKKGKGYSPAEQSPDGYHSVGGGGEPTSYHSEAAEELISLAAKNGKIVAITAAMGRGTGLDAFGEVYKDRYFDVGIAEEHALTFSAGLAANGLIPFVAIYSTFLQRGYDSILHDIALQELPVKILIDRAGLSLGDGATHHGIFDVAFLSHIPNMSIMAPYGYRSLRRVIAAAAESASAVAIRYSNAAENSEIAESLLPLARSGARLFSDFSDNGVPEYIFITYGKIVENVVAAKRILSERGVAAGIILVEQIKPYEPTARALCDICSGASRIVYVEEGIRIGGAAETTVSYMRDMGFDFSKTKLRIAAIEDNFASPSEPCDLYDFVGLSPEKIAEKMLKE